MSAHSFNRDVLIRRPPAGLLTLGLVLAGAAAAQTAVRSYITEHQGVFHGQTVSYSVTAEDTILKNAKGDEAGALFSFSYLRIAVQDAAARPVIFIFNGGPGSSSIWLHLSGLGPKRIAVADPASSDPLQQADSPFSILDAADLVFIDPIDTGFSRLLPAGRTQDFFGYHEDGRSIAAFMRQWLDKHQRWDSPRYVIGESYGTQRAGALVKALGDVRLDGFIMLGQAMDMSSTNPNPGNDMSSILILPSMAATAWYHNRVDRTGHTFAGFVDAARRFASTEYAQALFAGSTIDPKRKQEVVRRLSQLIGVPESVLLGWELRVTRAGFMAALLADQHAVLGANDGRFVAPAKPGAEAVDAVMDKLRSPFTRGLEEYLEKDLGIPGAGSYKVQSGAASIANWNWDTGEGGTTRFYFNVAPTIAQAMKENPKMRLMVGAGYYDLLTPLFSAEHTVSHSGIPIDRVRLQYYESGHMPYIGDASARKLSEDIRGFVLGRP